MVHVISDKVHEYLWRDMYNADIMAGDKQNWNDLIINSDNCLLSSDLTNEKHSQLDTATNNLTGQRRGEERTAVGVQN